MAQIDPLCQKTLIDTHPHRLARIYVIHTPQRSEDFNTLVQRHHGIQIISDQAEAIDLASSGIRTKLKCQRSRKNRLLLHAYYTNMNIL